MIVKFTEEQYQNTKSQGLLSCECYKCGKDFFRRKAHIKQALTDPLRDIKYCCTKCKQLARNLPVWLKCGHCGNDCLKHQKEIKKSKSGNVFCSLNCSTSYNNLHKTYGTKRSRIELYIEEQLKLKYPDLRMHFNQKSAINSELDIYVPNLKLAFELNGIFHYSPIHGTQKLNKIRENDKNKLQKCQAVGISLYVIDISSLNYYKPERANKYLKTIENIINEKLFIDRVPGMKIRYPNR